MKRKSSLAPTKVLVAAVTLLPGFPMVVVQLETLNPRWGTECHSLMHKHNRTSYL